MYGRWILCKEPPRGSLLTRFQSQQASDGLHRRLGGFFVDGAGCACHRHGAAAAILSCLHPCFIAKLAAFACLKCGEGSAQERQQFGEAVFRQVAQPVVDDVPQAVVHKQYGAALVEEAFQPLGGVGVVAAARELAVQFGGDGFCVGLLAVVVVAPGVAGEQRVDVL